MSSHSCCLQGFKWDATPQGREESQGDQKYYVTGSNPDVAILVIHDLYGWTFNNIRLLADQYANEIGATVYAPDFFGGAALPAALIDNPAEWEKLDLPTFMARNAKDVRKPEMIAFTQFLRSKHRRVGAIGFCYGGWAVFQLGAKTTDGSSPLVDCISTAHPTFLTNEEISNVDVPVQICAPELDPQFTAELKAYALAEIPKLGVPFDYQYFPGLEHGFAVRGNREDEAEMKGLQRAMRAAVGWFREWLVVAEGDR